MSTLHKVFSSSFSRKFVFNRVPHPSLGLAPADALTDVTEIAIHIALQGGIAAHAVLLGVTKPLKMI
jgi:hypothetical protein